MHMYVRSGQYIYAILVYDVTNNYSYIYKLLTIDQEKSLIIDCDVIERTRQMAMQHVSTKKRTPM